MKEALLPVSGQDATRHQLPLPGASWQGASWQEMSEPCLPLRAQGCHPRGSWGSQGSPVCISGPGEHSPPFHPHAHWMGSSSDPLFPFKDKLQSLRFCFFFFPSEYYFNWASLVAQIVKNLPAVWETRVQSPGWKDPLDWGMATQSSSLAWRIPRDRGAWRATVHGVVKSQTRLSD